MRLLYVICEGEDDQQFFERVVEPRLSYANHEVRYFQYAEYPAKEVRGIVRSIDGMRSDGIDANYLFIRDFDHAPCKEARFSEIAQKYDGLISRNRTFLVVQMIESWYAAGLPRQRSEELLGRPLQRTDELTKERFNNLLPEDASRIDFMQRLLQHFDMSRARTKNHSFEYFCSNVLD